MCNFHHFGSSVERKIDEIKLNESSFSHFLVWKKVKSIYEHLE